MPQILPKSGYVIRTKEGRPVMLDPELQIMPDGRRNEITFVDREMANRFLLEYVAEVRKWGDPTTEFEVIEVQITPDNVDWAMDKSDVLRKIAEKGIA